MKTILALFLAYCSIGLAKLPDSSRTLQKIGLGSCNFQRRSQSYWDVIGKENPDLWIWMGDIIYSDFLTVGLRRGEFDRVKKSSYYQNFISNVPVVGTWDDHDFGRNSAGISFKTKKESQGLVLDFLDEPPKSSRRTQEGIYTSYRLGEFGSEVHVILLDLRFFREDPGAKNDLLGAAQWAWLEAEWDDDPSDLTILVSSSEAIPFESAEESWTDYPRSRERLLKLISSDERAVLILSGDIHFGEISRLEMDPGRFLYELTSSGLTHSSSLLRKPNRYRVGDYYGSRNFGMVEIDWADDIGVKLQIFGIDGKKAREEKLTFQRD